MRRIVLWIPLLLVGACTSTEVTREGEEISLDQKRRLEAPVDLGVELLARTVDLQISRNYFKELYLPAGGGLHSEVRREPEKHRWVYRTRKAPTMQLLHFGMRKLKGHAVKTLTVECPPITDHRIRLRALGDVSLVVKSTGRTYQGQELLVDGGRITLDGRPVELRPASPPADRDR